MKHTQFPIAIIQGRLSEDYDNRYQFFPKTEWKAEFIKAAQLGFDGVEWLIDPKEWESNPIFNSDWSGAESVAQEAGVSIVSVCADWFMQVCLWEEDPEWHRAQIRSIIPQIARTKNKTLLIPLLETHDLRPLEVQKKVVSVLAPLTPELRAQGIQIGFETELTASALVTFTDMFEDSLYGVYYDIGNCTSYGFDCARDIALLGNRIKGVHLKDRKRGTTTPLPLGTGDVDFPAVINALREIMWNGTLVLQAWRGEDFITDAQKQLEYIRNIMNKN